MYAQLMWGTSPLFHFAILVYADSLTHLQTFKNCPLSSSLLRTRIRHSALARRHVTLLSTAESPAVPPDFCASCPRERPFQRAPGAVGGCPLAELVGSLRPKPGLQPQQPGWQEHIVPKCFCWVQAGRWGREKRARSGEHSRYWFYLLVFLTCSFPFLKCRGWKGSQKHDFLLSFEARSHRSQSKSLCKQHRVTPAEILFFSSAVNMTCVLVWGGCFFS